MNEYTISDVSKDLGIPSSTLRYYEEIGILKGVSRNASGKRVYKREHIDRLNAIKCFKGAGMTMSEIVAFFKYEDTGYEAIDNMMELLKDREIKVREQFRLLMASYAHLLRKIDYYGDIEKFAKSGCKGKAPAWEDYLGDYDSKARKMIMEARTYEQE